MEAENMMDVIASAALVNRFNIIGRDITREIFSYVTEYDLTNLAGVCRSFHSIARSLWPHYAPDIVGVKFGKNYLSELISKQSVIELNYVLHEYYNENTANETSPHTIQRIREIITSFISELCKIILRLNQTSMSIFEPWSRLVDKSQHVDKIGPAIAYKAMRYIMRRRMYIRDDGVKDIIIYAHASKFQELIADVHTINKNKPIEDIGKHCIDISSDDYYKYKVYGAILSGDYEYFSQIMASIPLSDDEKKRILSRGCDVMEYAIKSRSDAIFYTVLGDWWKKNIISSRMLCKTMIEYRRLYDYWKYIISHDTLNVYCFHCDDRDIERYMQSDPQILMFADEYKEIKQQLIPADWCTNHRTKHYACRASMGTSVMITASDTLNQRIKDVMNARNNDTWTDPVPTLVDREREHVLFVNAHFNRDGSPVTDGVGFKPFSKIGYEYTHSSSKVENIIGNINY
jgi:hypothetical protein